MAMFAISGHNIPQAHSYDAAVKVWDEAYQHGRFGAWRGLVNPRDTSKLVIKEGDRIRFRFHNTDLVTWFPDKVQVVCWDSVSSVIFAGCFTPWGISVCNREGSMYINQGDRFFQSGKDPATFNLVGGKAVVDEATVATHPKYVLDKKRAAAIRKVLAPAREHRDALLRLRGGEHRAEARSEGQLCRELDMMLKGVHTPEQHRKILLDMAEFYDDDIVLRNAYLVGGAVSKVQVNDEVRPKNVYAGRAGLHYL
jgi:hypothetical protein